ncbi:DUF6461 domain-containing protein [Planobispora siamensis]|uniref:DUF6461 domain-containing protein n=1 Tax=Planobispora siamensis TaxID=936338 RepID=UPI00194F0556|nr:DUF6461 domain-containing protein [Planobispora siamensis]
MAEVDRADIAWLHAAEALGMTCSLTFVRGVDEVEALRRLGADEGDIELFTGGECPVPEAVRAWRSGEWTVVIERWDNRLVDSGALDALSAGTEAIMIFCNVNAWSGFEYVVDGEPVTSFDPVTPDWREGSDPDRFVEMMRQAGFDPGTDPVDVDYEIDSPGFEGALLLATRLTGVVLTPEVFHGPLPGARVK